MKKILLSLALLLTTGGLLQAQEIGDALYTKDSSLQHFQVMLGADTAANTDVAALAKGKDLVLVYFSPDCGHCQEMAYLLSKKIEQFAGVQFVYTYFNFPASEAQKFAEKYGLADKANVAFAKDPEYSIPTFYRVEYTPTVAIYTKEGKLKQVLRTGITVDKIAEVLGIQLR